MSEGVPAILRFTVPGEPVGKERPRALTRTNKTTLQSFTKLVTPPKTRAYEAMVKLVAQAAVSKARWMWNDKDRFHVVIKIFCTHFDRHPDIDNCVKAILDSGNRILWRDDMLVRGVGVMMFQDKAKPRTEVEVRRVSKEECR